MKADMATFIAYLKYNQKVDPSTVTEEEFNTLKNYFFIKQEGCELEGDYEDFKAYLEYQKTL